MSARAGGAADRIRLDLALVERGLAPSRARAASLVVAGKVRIDGTVETKPARSIAAGSTIDIEPDFPWVSRAAMKLEAALDHWDLDPAGRVAVDVGASTGGFTQLLLARGAVRVYAVDVGHGQLAPVLAADPRVIALERLNARTLDTNHVPEPVDFITCDASFIGLETILPAPLALAAPGATLVALIKPQFEAGPGRVGKGGILRDRAVQEEVRLRIVEWLDSRDGWRVRGTIESPITGGDGNREFLICAQNDR